MLEAFCVVVASDEIDWYLVHVAGGGGCMEWSFMSSSDFSGALLCKSVG